MTEELDNVELYPSWRQALVRFREAGYAYGDTLPHTWLYEQFECTGLLDPKITWDAAQKKAHESLRQMGVPVSSDEVVYVPPKSERIEVEAEPKPKVKKPVHKRVGEHDLPPPPFVAPKIDHKLEALARAHVLLHWIRNNICAERPEVCGWIDEILDKAPKT